MKQQIVSRWNSNTVLFECDVPDDIPSGLRMRHALEQASTQGANLGGADLRSANLRSANLRSANLGGANLAIFRTDFFDILLRAPAEIAGLRAFIASQYREPVRLDDAEVVCSTPDDVLDWA